MGSLPAPLSAVLTPVGGLMQGLGETVSSPTSALMGSSSSVCSSGGLGFGERIFPPLTGLTFAAWIYIDRFSDLGADSHPIRLLTIVRVIQKTSKGHSPSDYPSDLIEQACFQIQISPIDHALLIATHESDTPGADLDRDVNSSDTFARVSIAELRQEQQWCHCAVVLTRSMLKNSSVSIYVNGRHRVTQKIHYISQNSALTASTSLGQLQTVTVKAIIGTAPGPFRKQSKLLWRTGSTYLIEEACSNQVVHQMYKLGSNYTGSFQAPVLPSGERLQPLIQEEKIVFGLNARAVSQMTLARLRKVYNKADGKSIARTLDFIIGISVGISSHENATPIRILQNSSAHLSGPSRSLGGVLIGYLGIRTFCPKPVAKLLESVGGSVTLLGLIGMAADTEGLYAAIKALLCAVKWNKSIAMEMDACRGYQTLAMLLKEKSHLLHSHVLHLIFSLIGTLDASHETASIPNVQAFEDLLCDLLAWRRASPDLQRLLYEHFYLLITESGFGQFIASTLPTACPADAEKKLPFDVRDLQSQLFSSECRTEDVNQLMLYQVYVRNRCLNILLNILLHTSGQLNAQVCEQVAKVLGFDWIIALLSSRSHSATVWAALKILLALTGYQTLMQKFKEGAGNGGWLKEAECVVQNRAGVVLGFSVSARCGAVGSACDLNPEICTMPGFLALQHVLPYHATLPDPFLALLSQLVGQPAKDLPHVHEFDLDGIWSLIFGLPTNHSVADAISKVELCPEASLPLLSLVRRCVTLNVEAVWCKQYPVTLIQFLTFLYHNVIEFSTYTTSEEFLTTLTATLFKDSEGDETRVKNDALPDHPAVKYIIDLLRNIIVDSFAFAPVTKGDTIIDMILENPFLTLKVIPEGSSRTEQSAFITHLLRSVMDHLVAADVLLCGQSLSLPLTLSVTSNYSVLAANVFYFTARTVDCIWNGLYVGDAQVVLDFILKLFNQVKRKGGNNVPADPLYFPLNRCTLFVLSRFIDGVNGQLSLLESLNKIIAARSIIFSQVNVDQEFFGCLCHLLFMLTDISNQELPLNVDNMNKDQKVIDEEHRIREGALLIANSARRLWEELFLSKKSMVEEIFHVSLVPEINAARALVGELANRCWHSTVDGETRGVVSRDAFQIHLQLQSKLQKVAGGLQRLANRKTGKPTSIAKNMPVAAQTLELWMKVHISLIRELVELMYTQYLQWHEHTEKWCLGEWRNLEQELTRERGLWGPFNSTKLSKWQLDSTEGPSRMRKKLIPNLSFYVNYPYRPSLDLPENKNLRCKVAISHDSKEFYERMKSTCERSMDQRIIDTSSLATNTFEDRPIVPLRDVLEINTTMIRKASRQFASSDGKSRSLGDDDLDDQSMSIDEEAATNPQRASENTYTEKRLESGHTELTGLCLNSDGITYNAKPRGRNTGSSFFINATVDRNNAQSSMITQQSQGETGGAASTLRGPDNQTLLRLLEEGEELQSMFRCARINGLETSEGLLLFGKQHYYVVDGFTLLKTKEIRDLDFLSEDLHDPIVPYIANGPQRQVGVKRLCSKFPYEDIREVHKRRYLLQPIALEVFSNDGRNYLLAFPKRVRNKVYSKFLAVARRLIDTADQSVSGQRTSVNLEAGASLFGALMGEMSVTQRWARGELTNFQYLMHLNTLAGRSYNDLSQYPIFPWILSDYDSEELDLTDPASFRDLSKPMGAQTPERLEQFMKRYREWDDPSGETLPYMYGTHYSSAMIVVSYLVRLEPFTQQFLKLQGGHFDLADRMFHSVREAWYSASKNNMADVKELIPEFFYLPEFLLNTNLMRLSSSQEQEICSPELLKEEINFTYHTSKKSDLRNVGNLRAVYSLKGDFQLSDSQVSDSQMSDSLVSDS
uniref:WD repeat and FYVE domain-containing protein 3 n=1 Tax=Romanomermis culicivorax TaxID=13658 RepID=A0A915IK38_ROMCU